MLPFFADLVTRTDEARREFETNPVVLEAVANGMPVERYRKLLLELYHVVWHFNPVCAAAASRVPDSHRQVRYFLYEHMQEESGHEEWVMNDLEAVGVAHVATRVVAAMATGAGVRELAIGHDQAIPEGRLAVRRRLGRQVAAMTTHVTADDVTRALTALPATASAGVRSRLERLRDALAALTRVQYCAAALDPSAVDEAVTTARDLATEMAREKLTSPREWFRRPLAPATPTPEF